jgi:Druantia protein DruA
MSRMRYCGREFTEAEITLLGLLIAGNPGITRYQLSIKFCKEVGWRKADGGLKDMSCRVALLRMHRDGHIILPAPTRPSNNGKKGPKRTPVAEPQPETRKNAGEYALNIEIVGKESSPLWNEYIDRYHYLGYASLSGAQLRYFVKADDQILALLGFGAAAWKTAPRDDYLGWDARRRRKNLHLIVNNARFLILPWVRSKNLGSKVLSMVSRRIGADWQGRYHYQPLLLETFVQKDRFLGTCYKAANWIYVGDTKGRGKLDRYNEYKLPVKSVWLYPLRKDFRRRLTEG